MLKPMLARGEIDCIGATTLKEYREYIEKDRALERRFQPVLVNEPTVEDTVTILRGLKNRFESFHGVKITDNALIAAATLSNRYLTSRFLPDKAIDLVDEACASIKVELASMPAELDELERKMRQLQIEKVALSKESDEASKKRLKECSEELDELTKKDKVLLEEWNKEKSQITEVKTIKTQLEKARFDLDYALSHSEYEKAGELQYKKIPELEKKLKEADSNKGEGKLLSEVVDEEQIARIISKMTNIPLSKIEKGDREKVLDLKQTLSRRVIGQDEALSLVSDAILRQRAGIKDSNRPIGSFLFLGPTGVGKTEVARALAESLFDSESHIIRIDMSEYMEKYSTSRLIGAPPGYVGYEEGGQLTEKVRRNPYSIVLFDEIEKAHPEVFNLLLQMLDDGRLTDSQGRVVDFKNTIIIMTSNLGSEYLLNNERDKVEGLLHQTFKPEFLNRIDEIVYFSPLSKEVQGKIVTKMLNDLNRRLQESYYSFEFTDAVKAYILNNAYSPQFGARPIKRFIQNNIETLIAREIVNGHLSIEKKYIVDYSDDKVVIKEA